MRRLSHFLALAAVLAGPAAFGAAPPPLSGTGGAVVSEEAHATEAGLAVLRAGGNAVDAAVATALALAVTFPEAGNLGGGGFAVVRIGGEIAALDFREVAPAAATPTMFLDAEGKPVPGASTVGPLAAAVPGSPHGLFELHRRFGRLPWKRVVEPARKLAADGFPVSAWLNWRLGEEGELLARFRETAAIWMRGGEDALPVGARLQLKDLARTLAAYAERGPEGIVAGPAAAAVEEVARRHGGVLTAADLAAYRPRWRDPLRFRAFGWEMAGMPLPSTGGVITAKSLALLERLGLARQPRFGADRAHLLAESWRRAYADRYLLGDPESTRATPAELLAEAALAGAAASFDPHRATPSAALQPVERPSPRPSPRSRGAREPEGSDTTHVSVVDGEGNLVALTTTLNTLFGCGLYVPGAGFFLNSEMDDFATAPGQPNYFGLVQGEASAVSPGRRPLSSMNPTLAWRGREAIVLGGRGGSLIPTDTMQVLLNLIVDSDGLQEAVNRPRLHHQWLPDELRAEADALSPETRAELERRGHTITIKPSSARVNLVRLSAGGALEAATEPRGAGAAGVVRQAP